MRKSGFAILAAAMALAAVNVYAQSDGRVFEAMRTADSGSRIAAPAPVAATDLVRIQAAGQSLPGAGAVREYRAVGVERSRPPEGPAVDTRPDSRPQSSVPEATKAQEEQSSVARAREADEKAREKGAVFYLRDASASSAQPRPYITETQRAAEHARYEANKRRGLTEPAVAASGQSRPRPASLAAAAEATYAANAPTHAVITWSQAPPPAPASVYAAPVAGYQPPAHRQLITPDDVVRARAILSQLR